jgi:predicted SnoaL-like aldol condensation-catalyzing enzyme
LRLIRRCLGGSVSLVAFLLTPNNMKHYKLLISTLLAAALVSCSQSNGIQERNKNTIMKVHEELLTKGNLAFADEAFSSEYKAPGFELKGPELIRYYVTELKRAFPDLQYKIDRMAAEGNMVTWTRTCTGTHTEDFMGYKATGKPVTWQETDFTQFDEEGKVVQEWSVTDFETVVGNASGIEGVYEYVAPSAGQASLRNGRFSFLYGQAGGSGQLIGQSGTYNFVDGKVICTSTHSTDRKLIGNSISWRPKSWSGDTLTFEIFNDKGEIASVGRSVRVSR